MIKDERPELQSYRTALQRAWLDGIITYDEAKMLNSLREHLDITEEEHWELESEIKSKGPDPGIQEYRAALVQAWLDGFLTDLEKEMLENLREKHNIDEITHKKLQDKVKKEMAIEVEADLMGEESMLECGRDDTDDLEKGRKGTEMYWIMKGRKTWCDSCQREADRKKVLGYFEKAISINPRNHLAWTYMGTINKKSGHIDEAIRCYDRALELKENYVVVWYNKGVLLAQTSLSKLEEAIKCFDEVLKINPNNNLALRDREILQELVGLKLEKKETA